VSKLEKYLNKITSERLISEDKALNELYRIKE